MKIAVHVCGQKAAVIRDATPEEAAALQAGYDAEAAKPQPVTLEDRVAALEVKTATSGVQSK